MDRVTIHRRFTGLCNARVTGQVQEGQTCHCEECCGHECEEVNYEVTINEHSDESKKD